MTIYANTALSTAFSIYQVTLPDQSAEEQAADVKRRRNARAAARRRHAREQRTLRAELAAMKHGDAIAGMVDCDGQQVHSGDIVEFYDWCCTSGPKRSPLYGVVRWNEEYFTYEPLVFVTEVYNGNSFAYVCRECNGSHEEDKPTYFKVIGSVEDLGVLKHDITQSVE